jgi:hypothetical protein
MQSRANRLLTIDVRGEGAEIRRKITSEARPLQARAHAKFGTVNGRNSGPLYIYLLYTYVIVSAQWRKTCKAMRWHGTTIY